MKFFIDTADIEEIKKMNAMGMVDGVTTNPSLILKSGREVFEVIKEIAELIDGPVSAEVVATDYDSMIKEARKLTTIADNICIKLPVTEDGIRACKKLSSEGVKVNMTLCFSPAQAILAAKAGATYISPFIGRLDDISHEGMDLIAQICEIYSNYPEFTTEVLVASIRVPRQVTDAALAGAHVSTIPPKVFEQLIKHPLTDIGLQKFLDDWKKTGQSLL